MTEYDLSAALADGTFIDWSSPSLWANGQVPDNSAALVVFQPIADKTYYVEIAAGESYKIGTLDMPAHHLLLSGSLAVKDGINVTAESAEIDLFDGNLTAGSIHLAGADFWRGITGVGSVTVSGQLYNQSSIGAEQEPNLATGTQLTVRAGTLVNTGLLGAGPLATLVVSATHFTNYSNGALSGGAYEADGGTVDLHTPGLVTIDDASLFFGNGTSIIASYDPASGHYVPFQSTLAYITAHGSLEADATHYTTSVGLSDYGSILISGVGAEFQGPRLSVAAGGTVTLNGASSSDNVVISVQQLSNNGTITAMAGIGMSSPDIISAPAITGTGTIVIGPENSDIERGQTVYYYAAAELTGPVSNAIKFSDGTGTVILDTPTGMTGRFQQFQAGDQIILSGVNYSSVTGYDYSGSTSSGVLTIHEGAASLKLAFTGHYATADFSLSSSAHGLDIVGVPPAGS
jgi:hypothetical protein